MPRRHNRRPPIRKKYTEPNKIPLVELWLRFGGICQYCFNPVDLEDASRDHAKPKSLGGRNGHDFENILLMCVWCNRRKARQEIERIA